MAGLILHFLGNGKAGPGKEPGYRFKTPVLKEGEQRLDGVLVLKQLRRLFGSVSADDAPTIGGLSTGELEDLAEALLAFGSPVDLMAWLINRRSRRLCGSWVAGLG